jgi:predicted Zn-dependent protease
MNEKKLAEAEAVLRQGAERFPATAAMHFDLGSVLVLQGRIDEAMAALRRGVELDPEYLTRERQFATGPGLKEDGDPELSFSYARLFAAAGNAAKTAEFLQRAKKAGFKDWQRIAALNDFDPVRDDPALKEFLK